MGFTTQFCVRSISPEPLERFSLNFTHMFRSLRQYAEPMTLLCILMVKVTLQGHEIYPSILRPLHLLNPLKDIQQISLKCSSQ